MVSSVNCIRSMECCTSAWGGSGECYMGFCEIELEVEEGALVVTTRLG